MNSETITGAASPLTSQFEATKKVEEPSVPDIDLPDEVETDISDDQETEAGVLRLVDFIRRRQIDKKSKNFRALQAYENAKHFKDKQESGAFLNVER